MATDHLHRGLELSQRADGVEFQITAHLALAQLRQAQGEDSAAQQALQAGWGLIERPGTSPSAQLRALATRVLIALAGDDPDDAAYVVERLPRLEDVEFVPDRLLLMLVQTRLLLARDEPAAALRQLEAREAVASRTGWESALVQNRALQALAAPTRDQALTFLSEALATAERERYVRTFTDLGKPMAQLLQDAAARGIAIDYLNRLLTAFEEETRDNRRKTKPTAPSLVLCRSSLIEPLSEREFEVLGLLVAGQTYQEIAQALYLSINTVKTHLKNISGKLGVHNRRQAVGRAKELDLLP